MQMANQSQVIVRPTPLRRIKRDASLNYKTDEGRTQNCQNEIQLLINSNDHCLQEKQWKLCQELTYVWQSAYCPFVSFSLP